MATVDFDCASGTIDEAIFPGEGGVFSVKGTYRTGQSGPIKVGQIFRSQAATYAGTIAKEDMTLSVSLSAADPLNLVGVVTPGERIPAIRSNRVLLKDGVPVARKVGATIEILSSVELENGERSTLETALVRRPVSERFARRTETTKLSEAR